MIHMETEVMNDLVVEIQEKARLCEQLLSDLHNTMKALDWQGANRDHFVASWGQVSFHLSEQLNQMDALALRVKLEVEEWIEVDSLSKDSFKLIPAERDSFLDTIKGFNRSVKTSLLALFSSVSNLDRKMRTANIALLSRLASSLADPKIRKELIGDSLEVIGLVANIPGPLFPIKPFITGDPRDFSPIPVYPVNGYDIYHDGPGIILNTRSGPVLFGSNGKEALSYDPASRTYSMKSRSY